MEKLKTFIKQHLKKNVIDIRPGDTIRVYQKIKEKGKERSQVFEGLVLARKHGKEAGATITVRKVVSGIGVEKIFPIHSPIIDKIEIVKRGKVRRAKLYYLRTAKGRKARLKKRKFSEVIAKEESSEKIKESETVPEIVPVAESESKIEDNIASKSEPEKETEAKTEEESNTSK